MLVEKYPWLQDFKINWYVVQKDIYKVFIEIES